VQPKYLLETVDCNKRSYGYYCLIVFKPLETVFFSSYEIVPLTLGESFAHYSLRLLETRMNSDVMNDRY
jgi:hypothetical protein